MNFIHIPCITVAIIKTGLHIKGDPSGVTFQWLLLLTFIQIADLFGGFKFVALLCAFVEIFLAYASNVKLIKYASIIEMIPTERILTEIKFQVSVVLISAMSRAFKAICFRMLKFIENQNLNDERQSKLSQQLLDVSQYIETETQQRCNKSQFLDQTLNLNYTVIEKSEEVRENNNDILKELEMNSATKPQIPEPEKKKPQAILKQSIPIAQVVEKALPMPPMIQKVQSLRGSVNGVQSCDLDSMRKTLDLLKNSDKKKIEEVVVETIQSKQPQMNQQMFEKLQQCKEKITKQQQLNAQVFGTS